MVPLSMNPKNKYSNLDGKSITNLFEVNKHKRTLKIPFLVLSSALTASLSSVHPTVHAVGLSKMWKTTLQVSPCADRMGESFVSKLANPCWGGLERRA